MPSRESERDGTGPRMQVKNPRPEDEIPIKDPSSEYSGQPVRGSERDGRVPESKKPGKGNAGHLKKYQWKKGQQGNVGGIPRWRRELKRVWNDGMPYFEKVAAIARGEVIYIEDLENNKRIKVVPNVYAMLAAFKELRDTAVGKPVQQVILSDSSEDQGAQEIAGLVNGLTYDEQQILREVAKKALIWRDGQRRQSNGKSRGGTQFTEEPLIPEVVPDSDS